MNKKLLLALWIYATWVATALVYNKKTPSEIKIELQKSTSSWGWNFKVLFNNFIEIHQNLLESIKTKLLTEKNKEYFFQKKDEINSKLLDFKINWEKLLEEYKILWKDYSNDFLKKLEIFYEEKIKELDELNKKKPEKIDDIKKGLLNYFEELKEKIKN